jgi:hypothetical protein
MRVIFKVHARLSAADRARRWADVPDVDRCPARICNQEENPSRDDGNDVFADRRRPPKSFLMH